VSVPTIKRKYKGVKWEVYMISGGNWQSISKI
jgi:hypothetical protein